MNARKPRLDSSEEYDLNFSDANPTSEFLNDSKGQDIVNHKKGFVWSEWSDEKIVHEYHHSGAMDLFGELYQRYMLLVLGTCLKYLGNRTQAQDASNEVFIKLIDQLRKTKPLSFKVWLYVVTKNYCLEKIRSGKREPSMEPMGEHNLLDLKASKSEEKDSSIRDYWFSLLRNALQKLPAKQRKSIELFFFEGLRYREIAQETGWSLNEVKSYIQNGKRNLKNFLGGYRSSIDWI